jgi:uncharacterized protein YkwD
MLVHRQLRGRMRPFVLLCSVLAVSLRIGAASPALAQESSDADKLRVQALELVNKARAEHKLPPLQLGKEINAAAKYHAADMLRRNFYDHTSPEGKTVADRYQSAGGSRWKITAENIARCIGCDVSAKTVEDLQRGWMNSKGHRENILRQGIAQFGFSIVGEAGRPLYAVQTFTGPGVPSGLGADEQPRRLSDAEATAKALEILNKERKAAGRPAFVESPALTKAVRSLLPTPTKLDDFNLSQTGKVMEALPPAERKEWLSLATLAGACGGCGTEPTDVDVRSFVQQWLGNASNKAMVMNPASTDLAFALVASGQGKKVALAVLGRKQLK